MHRSLRPLLEGPLPATAPLVLNPLMARQAERAGFQALYLGGGALGYQKVFLEANLGLAEMAQAGVEVMAATELPLILDGASGWGDPMHMHRTIPTAEAAGFAAIEIEDQILPKRAHHHVGVDHMVRQELMEAKVREAVAARRDPEFVIIARTNAQTLDEAVRRGEAYRQAGADALMLTLASVDPAQVRLIGERLAPPLVLLSPPGGLNAVGLSLAELGKLGYRLVVDGQTIFFLLFEAAQAAYAELAGGDFAYRQRPPADWKTIQQQVHDAVRLERLLEVEKETVEKDLG